MPDSKLLRWKSHPCIFSRHGDKLPEEEIWQAKGQASIVFHPEFHPRVLGTALERSDYPACNRLLSLLDVPSVWLCVG